MKNTPGYFGILPAHVRYDKTLPPMARIMYSEITALSNKNGYCNAGNNYFAELYEVSTVTVSRWINKLKKGGHVQLVTDTKTGHNRKIYPLNKNVKPPIQKDQAPLNKNVKHNNTSIIIQDNKESKSENLPNQDLFEKVDGLKKDIGPKHYQLLNEACQDSGLMEVLRGMFKDGRFEMLRKWLKYKKEIRKGYKSSMSIIAMIEDFSLHTPLEVKTAINDAIRSGYMGVFAKSMSDAKVRKQDAKVKNLINGYGAKRKRV